MTTATALKEIAHRFSQKNLYRLPIDTRALLPLLSEREVSYEYVFNVVYPHIFEQLNTLYLKSQQFMPDTLEAVLKAKEALEVFVLEASCILDNASSIDRLHS